MHTGSFFYINIKDHGKALLGKYPISTVVTCEREVCDDHCEDTSKEHGIWALSRPTQHA